MVSASLYSSSADIFTCMDKYWACRRPIIRAVAPDTLTVISRNHEYTELLNGSVVRIMANFGIAANGDGVPLDHASIKFRVMSSTSDRTALEYPLEWSKRYSGLNQDRDRDSAAVNIPRDVIAQFAIKECNKEKERMPRNQSRTPTYRWSRVVPV